MALVKGTNSYATVLEADTYFADRIDVAAWTSADATKKSQALITATASLDEQTWAGEAVSVSQPLAFPRIAEYFDPKLGKLNYLDGTLVPDRVIKACYELAYHLVKNSEILDASTQIKNIQVGSIKLDNVINISKMSPVARQLIRPLLINGGSNVWFRAN